MPASRSPIHGRPSRPHADARTRAAEVRARLPDAAFNALRGQRASQSTHGWPDNRALELDGTLAAYDAWGNLIERIDADGTKLELSWDGADRLISLWRRDANGQVTEARYAYDALGRRIRKEVTEPDGTSTTRFGWEGDRQVTEDIDGQLTRTTVYEPESFVPLARIEMRPGAKSAQDEEDDDSETDAALAQMLGQVKHMLLSAGLALPKQLTEAQAAQAKEARVVPRIGWFHTDHLGTPLALTDSEGQLLWYGRPDDWGAIGEAHGSVSQPLRFQGQYHDAESGLYYNRHRYYDPQMGRYVSQDPIGLAGGMNFYAYPANPLRWVDPFGLQESIFIGQEKSTDTSMRPDGLPRGEGCGDTGTDWIVPDGIGKASFMKACSPNGGHDGCYATLGADKNACDDKLEMDIKAACDEQLDGLHVLYKPICKLRGTTYRFILKDLNVGQKAFEAAQEDAFWKMIDERVKTW